MVGHVVDICDCRCLPRKTEKRSIHPGLLDMLRDHKRKYVYNEEEFQQGIRRVREMRVVDVNTIESQCRRFISDGKRRCRLEYGSCMRDECGRCFQLSGRWQSGDLFVRTDTQLHMTREFF